MLRTPLIHFDYLRKSPGGMQFFDLVVKLHEGFTDENLIAGHCNRAIDELDGTTRMSSYVMMLYDRFGQNTFVVGPKVQELFRRTELSKISPDMITPPAPAFYVALADCPWTIWGGDRTQMHNLTGVYVSFSDVGQYDEHGNQTTRMDRSINFMLWGAPNERSINPWDDTVLWYSLSLDRWVETGEDLETFFRQHSVMKATPDDLSGFDPRLKDGPIDPFDPFAVPFIPSNPEDQTTQREALVNVLRLVLNVCLYMGSEDPELEIVDKGKDIEKLKAQVDSKKSPGKRKKLERRIANMPKTKFIYVGPLYEDLAQQESEQRQHQGGTHASPIEHGVPPHWQRYWVGSGEDRKRVWKHKGMYRRGSGKPQRTITKIRE